VYDFIKFDESAVLEEAIAEFESETNLKLFAGDERRILINTCMYPAKVIASYANYLANQYSAKTAVFPYLTYIGEGRSVFQLMPQKSLVNMQFNLAAVQLFDITIPKGTRVTPNGTHFFATTEEKIIIQGQLNVIIPAEATVAGTAWNGFTANTINTLVDNVLYISSVTNIDTSEGGAEIEGIESYRERVLLKPFGYNTAGAEEAYIYLTKSADSNIGSVSVDVENANVIVTILNKDGSIPSDLVVTRVMESLSGKKVRPITDNVTVQKATEVNYSIDISYTINPEDTDIVSTINSKVVSAITDYIGFQKSALGRAINPDILRKYIMNAGAYTVTISSPIYTAVNKQSVAQLSGEPIITYSGIYT
jgi:phage-related baseplate assembly protein